MKIVEARRRNGTYRVTDAQKKKLSKAFSGSKNPSWKGGKIIDKSGYVLLHRPRHPFCNSKGYVREHRLIMEDKIGRYLFPKEVVHHINEVKSDNRISNLRLYKSGGKHLVIEHIKRNKLGRFTK